MVVDLVVDLVVDIQVNKQSMPDENAEKNNRFITASI